MKNGYLGEVTLEHGNKTSGVYMVESWIIENPTKDKSNLYGFTLPKGTWFSIYSVAENPKVWERVKAGEFNGFSIEGLFEHKKSDLKLAMEKEITELSDIEAQMVLNKIINILKNDARYKKGQRVDVIDLEGVQPGIVSSYPGQFGPGKKKKKDDK
jgi:hypothetical protein